MTYFLSHTYPDIISSMFVKEEYGSKIRIKCHQPVIRLNKTLDGDNCVNWEYVDSFGVSENFNESLYYPLGESFGWAETGRA